MDGKDMILKNRMKSFFISEKQRIEHAYICIEVLDKSGHEMLSEGLLRKVEPHNYSSDQGLSPIVLGLSRKQEQYVSFWKLKKYLNQTREKQVVLTDDIIYTEGDTDFEHLINAIPNADINILFYVDPNHIYEIKEKLWNAYKSLLNPNYTIHHWLLFDKQYVFEAKYFYYWDNTKPSYNLRVYEDGSGAIIIWDRHIKIDFFLLKEELREQFISRVSKRADWIMANPQPALAVDDRHGNIPIYVEYNIASRNPDFDSLVDDWKTYEYFYYYDSEKKCDDFRLLLQDPSVKRIMSSLIN